MGWPARLAIWVLAIWAIVLAIAALALGVIVAVQFLHARVRRRKSQEPIRSGTVE
jgi:membrane protein implicated in regulation of membrane protease activity